MDNLTTTDDIYYKAIQLAKESDQTSSKKAIDYKIELSSDGNDRVFGLYEDSPNSNLYFWLDTGISIKYVS